MIARGRLQTAGLVGCCALLAPAAGRAGDDDKPPAYKIYIDPVTGKYTTEDPAASQPAQPAVAAAPVGSGPAANSGTGSPFGTAAVAVIVIVLLAAAFAWHRRQPQA